MSLSPSRVLVEEASVRWRSLVEPGSNITSAGAPLVDDSGGVGSTTGTSGVDEIDSSDEDVKCPASTSEPGVDVKKSSKLKNIDVDGPKTGGVGASGAAVYPTAFRIQLNQDV
jgi:hypothetical protein